MMSDADTVRLPTHRPARPPRRGSRRWLVVGLIMLALMVALVASISLLDAVAARAAAAPRAVASAYCADLVAESYPSAYTLLAPTAQARQAQPGYVEAATLHQQIDGPVRACQVRAPTPAHFPQLDVSPLGASTAAATVTLTRAGPVAPARAATVIGVLHLVKTATGWRIAATDAALDGTDLAPFVTAQTLCAALVAQQYDRAYAAFAPTYQSVIGSSATYAVALHRFFGTGQVTLRSCAPDPLSYRVAGTPESATVRLDLAFEVAGGGSPVDAVQQVTLAPVGGVWRVTSWAPAA